MKTSPERLPPHSPEAEAGVLGCCLLAPTGALNECLERGVTPHWFYEQRHQMIFGALTALYDAGTAIDGITLRQHLRDAGELDKVGGPAYLSELPDKTPSAGNLEHYLDICADKYRLRRLLALSVDLQAGVFDDKTIPADLVASATRAILAVGESSAGGGEQPIKPIILEVCNKLETYHRGSAQIKGLTTPIPYLDKMLLGLGGENGNFYVLAARPGIGKTSFALDLALHAAIDHEGYDPAAAAKVRGVPVAIFSLEMSSASLGMKLVFQRAGGDIQRWRTGMFLNEDEPKLVRATAEIGKCAMWIDDDAAGSIETIKSRARRMVRQHGIKLFILDYIQLLRVAGTRFREDRVRELEFISNELRELSKEMQVPWLVLAQMNRDYEKDPTRKPRLSDLKNCGAIEQDADAVMFLYHPRMDDEEKQHFEQTQDTVYGTKQAEWSRRGRRVNMEVAKYRYGPTGTVELLFQPSSTRFFDWNHWLKQHDLKSLAKGERPPTRPEDMPSREEILGLE